MKGKFLGRLAMMVAASAALLLGVSGMANAAPAPVAHQSASSGGATPNDVGATLTSAVITFHTLDDNRDHDSALTIQVLDANGSVKAQANAPLVEYRDDSTNSVTLRIRPNVKWESLVGGSVRFSFQPVGDDTWWFGYDLDLEFSDGDFSETVINRTVLSTDDNMHSDPLTF